VRVKVRVCACTCVRKRSTCVCVFIRERVSVVTSKVVKLARFFSQSPSFCGQKSSSNKFSFLCSMAWPGVNFSNILQAEFAQIFFYQKLQSQIVIREKLCKTRL